MSIHRAIGLGFAFLLIVGWVAAASAGPATGDPRDTRPGEEAGGAEYLWPLAEAGEAWAQYNLGLLYQRGDGVEQSDALAAYWYGLAAQTGDTALRLQAGLRLVELRIAGVGAPGGRRVALVMANAAYLGREPFVRAARDGADMADLFRRLGFEVTMVKDQDRAAAVETVLGFLSRSEGAEIAIVYYSGLDTEGEGGTLLVPVDARPAANGDIRLKTVSLGLMLRAVENSAKLGLVILDTLADDRFAASPAQKSRPGQPAPAAGPVVIVRLGGGGGANAADDRGEAGEASALAQSLIRHLGAPGLDLGEVLGRVRADLGRQRLVVSGSGEGLGVVLVPVRQTSDPGDGANPALPDGK